MINEFLCPYCSAENMIVPLQDFFDETGSYEYRMGHVCISCGKEMTTIVYNGGDIEVLGQTVAEYDEEEMDFYHSLEGPSQEDYDELELDIDESEIYSDDPNYHRPSKAVSYDKLLKEANGNYILYSELLKTVEWRDKRLIIKTRDKDTCQICFKNETNFSDEGSEDQEFSLHIHHKLYVHKALPWDYNDEDLITLCSSCHWDLHQKETIKVYNRVNDVLYPLEFRSCSRCQGAGIFPEYRHVDGGVCFKCNGERYFIVGG